MVIVTGQKFYNCFWTYTFRGFIQRSALETQQ